MITIQEARRIVLEHARPLARREQVPVRDAVGRRLAEAVASDTDLPPFDRVMMDGFAVRSADVGEAAVAAGLELPVVSEIAAGAAGDRPLASGEAVAIMTGAPLPPGADAVVPIEWTEARGGARIAIARAVRPGQHVAPRAEDVGRGDVVARAGELVTPLSLSLLIAAGPGSVSVVARPRVAVLTSGDELVPPGTPLRRGQIRESNGPALCALLRATGAEVSDLGVAKDTREALAAKLEPALSHDVVVLTGGSSVGRYDFSAEVVESFGAVRHFDRVSVKPGKPTLFHTRGETLVFCLPGNPVAALMTGRVLVAAALRRLAGDAVPGWPELALPLAAPVRRNPARDLLVPVRREDGRVAFAGWHGSGDLACMAEADAFGFVARGEGEAPAGTPVPLFPLPEATAW